MRKLKIALLFDYVGSKDLRSPENGNPGIGGTQYNFLTLAHYYSKFFPGEVQWTFLCKDPNLKLPEFISTSYFAHESDIEDLLKTERPQLFIWRPTNEENVTEYLENTQTPGVAWIHNVPSPKTLQKLASSTLVKRVVFAGHEALDLVRDHLVIKKSTVIFNGFDDKIYKDFHQVVKEENLVVFLGSLTYAKGFHLLAQIWPDVLKKVPDANLWVIGSGKLYNENEKLGPHKIAEEKYERELLEPLLNAAGDIHPSVKFLGVLGREMIPILQKTHVGVINPHGRSEVCPGSAIEFLASGTPVVAGARYGNLDVIDHGISGFTEKNLKKLTNRIIHLLRNPELAKIMGREGAKIVNTKFDQQTIVIQWHRLLQEVMEGKTIDRVYPMKNNIFYNFKLVFELLRILKFSVGILKAMPSIYEFTQRHKFS